MGNNSPFKPHFHESYMIDIVPVLFAGEILSTKILENHRYGNTVFTRQYYSAVLSDFVCHNKLLLLYIPFLFLSLLLLRRAALQLFEAEMG